MFQRLIAIPQEEYLQLTRVQQARQPITQQFYNLDRQYNEQARIDDPYNRLMLQSETLDEMKELKERMRQDITSSTPKPYQKRAHALFQSMQPYLKFNNRGEIYNFCEQLIPHSRLEDLIQHAVRDRRRNLTPTGWDDFRHLLKRHNVPKFMLNRDTLEELDAEETIKKEEVMKRETTTPPASPKRKVMKASKIPRLKAEPVMLRPKRQRKDNPKYGKQFGFLKYY